MSHLRELNLLLYFIVEKHMWMIMDDNLCDIGGVMSLRFDCTCSVAFKAWVRLIESSVESILPSVLFSAV